LSPNTTAAAAAAAAATAATAASVCPAMIGGARSAKSPRDQAYIYFACFEGRAAGGC